MSKTYSGARVNGEAVVVVVGEGQERRLDPAYHLKCLSPDGFDWGHSSRGGEQLALALLADALGDGEVALALYKEFAADWVRGAPRPEWVLFHDQLLGWALDKSASPKEPVALQPHPDLPSDVAKAMEELPAEDRPAVFFDDKKPEKKRRK